MNSITDTEEKIIRAATEVFLEKGKDGARMQEIAARANINKAMLHYYFRSKDKLYEKVFKERIYNFFNELFNSVPETDDVRTLLRQFISNYIDLLASRPELIRFVMWELKQGTEYVGETLRELFSQHGFSQFPFQEKIQNAVDDGSIRAIEPSHLIISTIGMCVYPFIAQPILEKVFPGLSISSPDFVQKRKQEIFHLIWKGIER